ncbi:ArgS-related anticodon-binding protein NrtL [Streptomyces polygonati]|uniref:arginine--tRNA ligase n=1 Tax=Streptomyces polygonati TaxID=1617087 RepID=A0ABV8HKV0_9ACTN
MTPAELSRAVIGVVRRAVEAEELRVVVPETVIVRRPPRPGCGDYATNVALQLAGPAGRTPYEVAEILARRLEKQSGIAQVEIAGRGFLNITLSAGAYGDVVRQVREQRARYGYGDGSADDAAGAEGALPVVAGEPGALRGQLVAEVVNRLLRVAAGRAPAPPGTPPGAPTETVTETVTVQEPPEAAEPLEAAEPPEPGPPDAPGGPTAPAPAPGAPAPPLGSDATRWALLRPPGEDTPRLTPDLLEQRESNPLFRVRYAHARTQALVRNAHDLGVPVDAPQQADPAPYHHPAETELLGLIADFPRVIETAARRRAPDRVARHLERLADAFFRFHDECPPLPKGDEKPSSAHAARIRLADATGVVLAGGLDLLGISAPDHM